MRILHCNTQERSGGAAIAANRLHRAFLAAGVDSGLAVAVTSGETPQVLPLGGKITRRLVLPVLSHLEKLVAEALYTRPEHPAYTTFSVLPSLQHRRINVLPKDILHLHWLGNGFLSPWALGRLRGPVVWTMHDTWPFTGGCHFQCTSCERYLARCGSCPELGSHYDSDLSRLHWHLKRRAIQRLKPVMISPSKEYARRADGSGMLHGCRVEHIPNGIDANIFRPLPKAQARNLLGLPQEQSILLFGAMEATSDHNKGFDLLCRALNELAVGSSPNFLAVFFGASEPEKPLPFPSHFLGRLHDDLTLTLAYSAADVFVCPSRQENLPNTVLESLACGTPVAAFAVGGIPDMLEHGVSGYLAQPQDAADLARGMTQLLQNAKLRQRMGAAGREKVEREFALPLIVKKHIELYENILQHRHKT